MNPEKELLVQICLENFVLRDVTEYIRKLAPRGESARLPSESFASELGLSLLQTKKAIHWLERKGLLSSNVESSFPQLAGRYKLDEDLWDALPRRLLVGFRRMGEMILGTFDEDRSPQPKADLYMMFLCDDGNIKDSYGGNVDARGPLMTLEDAVTLRGHLSKYIESISHWSKDAFANHIESRQALEWFASRSYGPNSKRIRHLPPARCRCDECKYGYEKAFTALTNCLNYEKQEQKKIRDALKQLS